MKSTHPKIWFALQKRSVESFLRSDRESLFVLGFAAGLAIIGLIAVFSGCERKPAYPPVGYTETTVTESFSDGGTLDEHREGTGQGAGLVTNSPEVAAEWEAGSPTAGLDGSAGGTTVAGLDLSSDTGKRALIGLAALFLVGAALAFWRALTRLAVALGVCGVGMLVVAFYPSVLLWCVLAAAGAGLVLLFASDANRARLFGTLKATTEAVEGLPDGMREATKSQLSSKMDQIHKRTIEAVKFKAKVKGKR